MFHARKYFLLFLLLWFWLSDSLFCPGVDGLSHPSPVLPTDSNFDSLFQQFTTFIFSSKVNGGQVSTAEVPAFSGYQVCLWFEIAIIPFFLVAKAVRWCKFTFRWGLPFEEHSCYWIFTAEKRSEQLLPNQQWLSVRVCCLFRIKCLYNLLQCYERLVLLVIPFPLWSLLFSIGM